MKSVCVQFENGSKFDESTEKSVSTSPWNGRIPMAGIVVGGKDEGRSVYLNMASFSFGLKRIVVQEPKDLIKFNPAIEFIEYDTVLVIIPVPPFVFAFPIRLGEGVLDQLGLSESGVSPNHDDSWLFAGLLVVVDDELDMLESSVVSGVFGGEGSVELLEGLAVFKHLAHCEQSS